MNYPYNPLIYNNKKYDASKGCFTLYYQPFFISYLL